MRDALVQIVLRLRDDVLKDRERGHNQSAGTDSYYSGGTGFSAHSVLPSVPPVAPVSYEQRDEAGSGLGMRSSSNLYGYGSLSVCKCFALCCYGCLGIFVVFSLYFHWYPDIFSSMVCISVYFFCG